MGCCQSCQSYLTKKELIQATRGNLKPFDVNLSGLTGLVVEVIDGDTYDIGVKYKGEINLFRVRLYGVNCPETRTRDLDEKGRGLESKRRVTNHIKGKFVTFINPPKGHKEKYGRCLYLLKIEGEETDLSSWIIKNNLGVPYL